MKREALHVEFYRRPLSSSHHEGRKINFHFLYLHFIFRLFYIDIREDPMGLSETRRTYRLFIDNFGHDVQQPSPRRDVNRT